jgi:intein-encoded DNA endonuclease-like protein
MQIDRVSVLLPHVTEWLRLPPDKRISIYEETLAYHKQNPSETIAAVRNHIQHKYQMKVTYYAVHRWVRGQHDPRNWFNSPDRASDSFSYFLGATISDGCCYANAKRISDRSVILRVKDYDFAKAFADAAAKAFGKAKCYKVCYSQGRYGVKVNSLLFYNLISKGVDSFRPVIYKYPSSFIRGFFDGDGDVTTSVSKGKLLFCVRATNSNMQYLRLLDDLLRRFFDISGNIHLAHSSGHQAVFERRHVVFKSPVYVLKIDGIDQLSRFAASIGFEIRRKQQKLVDVIRLVRGHGSRMAAMKWVRLYEKKNGFWTRKDLSVDQCAE